MLTVIVPLDFSEPSFNSAHYAYEMYKDRKDVTIILYHFYKDGEDIISERNYLESLKKEFSTSATKIETLLESGHDFIDSLSAFAHGRTAYMIIMTLSEKSQLVHRFTGSNALKVVEKNICPVLIVPAKATFNGVNNVVLTSEMKFIQEGPTMMSIKKVLADFKPFLHVLNVDSKHYISLTEEFKTARDNMEAILAEFNPEFYFMRLFDFTEAVNLFTKDKKIDMIIIGPKMHSLFEKIFKSHYSSDLIYQSEVPVLAVLD
ncbi:universal stress protein [Ferruginibacter lapsinanis]|uniref:universal stress protein n=1 Tax=Ferruginibacter lapsinanis TaxID=563172 RepID=UPI001E435267|nr:universal stress protein [Ferruginibacter lapsinanis]UEG49607.1 universal stress protein [Ferruginibacter lapsinanis]